MQTSGVSSSLYQQVAPEPNGSPSKVSGETSTRAHRSLQVGMLGWQIGNKGIFRGTNEAFYQILLLRRKTTPVLKETLSTTKTSYFKRTIDRCLEKHMKNNKITLFKRQYLDSQD